MSTSSASPPGAPAGKPTFRDVRPIEPVPVSYGVAWMYFGIVLCMAIAWWFPVTFLVKHWMYPPGKPRGPKEATAFAALVYEGVSTKTNEVSAARFREHLQALNDAGYVPLSLDEVRALYAEGRPVPNKGVLLTFDHARKTTYFSVEAALRRAGWRAVMFLWTRPMEERDPASLLWPYVRNMARSGIWEFGAQSHDGFASIPASRDGAAGHFMTTRRWLDGPQRAETQAEFQARLGEDHARCLAVIRRSLRQAPAAYAYPYGDFGQYDAEAQEVRWINMGWVARHYALGFVTGNFALNTQASDPRRLNRLRVRPEWSGRDLVAALDQPWPKPDPVIRAEAGREGAAWIVDWGRARRAGNGFSLTPDEAATGAKMWLAGSELSQNVTATIRFVLHRGQLGLYLRSAPDGEAYVYLGIGSGRFGEQDNPREPAAAGVWLRQKPLGGKRFTLAASQAEVALGREHTLELTVRDRLMGAVLDGKPLFPTHVALRGEPHPGMVGVSVWDAEPAQARVDIVSAALDRPPADMAGWAPDPELEPHVVAWLHRNALRLTELCPAWMQVSQANRMTQAAWTPSIFKQVARLYALKTVPQVVVRDEAGLSAVDPQRVASQASSAEFDGVLLNLGALTVSSSLKVTHWLRQWGRAFADAGLPLYVKLPQGFDRRPTIVSVLGMVPQVQIAVAPGLDDAAALASSHPSVKRLEDVPPPAAGARLPFSYEIAARAPAASNEAETAEARISRLQEEGQAAFDGGAYTNALASWSLWHELDPVNPRAFALMGDAWARLGESVKALECYDASLDLDAGQIALLLRRIYLLESMGLSEEARQSLNFYSRLFPDHPDVLMAQAKWLRTHGRDTEALPLLERILERRPGNIEALALQAALAAASGPLAGDTFRGLADLGAKPENQARLAQAIGQHDLLAIPSAWVLADLVEDLAATAAEPETRLLYERLRSRGEAVRETFGAGRASEAWQLSHGRWLGEGPSLGRMAADPEHTEANLRWLGSDRLPDAFIEAQLHEVKGSCWLYARRTADHYIRFGYDPKERLHLQVCQGGRVLHHRTEFWSWPDQPFALRLEIRGDGVRGLVNGQPVFQTPEPVPPGYGYGWLGVAVHDDERGAAVLSLSRLAAGALPVRLAVLPELKEATDVPALLDALHALPGGVTGLSPLWFTLRPRGQCESRPMVQDRLVRLYVRYHRLRLLPVVDVEDRADPADVDLDQLAREHRADGFVLRFRQDPPPDTLSRLRAALDGSPLYVLAVGPAAGGSAACHPLAAARDLFPARRDSCALAIVSLDGEAGKQAVGSLPDSQPALLVYP